MKPFLEAMRDFIRPITVALLILVLLLGAVISGGLEAFLPGLGIKFTGGVAGWFRAIPAEYYTLTAAALLGYTAARSAEKWKHGHGGAQRPPAGSSDYDSDEEEEFRR